MSWITNSPCAARDEQIYGRCDGITLAASSLCRVEPGQLSSMEEPFEHRTASQTRDASYLGAFSIRILDRDEPEPRPVPLVRRRCSAGRVDGPFVNQPQHHPGPP
jgi:hypothetical protein